MENKRTYAEAVTIMVKWWIDKSFETTMNQDNGDSGLAHILLNTVSMSAQTEVTPEKVEKFRDKLTEILLKNEDGGRWDKELDVDYHPNSILSEACKFAGIDSACLPVKTFTYIDKDNTINGRYQYGGDWFKI